MINYINASSDDVRFMFITPYLAEIERIISSCPQKGFVQPSEMGTKLNGIKYLLRTGCNIASTHSLFSLFDEEVVSLVEGGHYILIMDEVPDVIEKYLISAYDANTILEKYTSVDESGKLSWCADKYEGKFDEYRNAIEAGCVYQYGTTKQSSFTALLWMFPIQVFNAFDDVFIMTYMFDAQIQRYYFDYHNIAYRKLFVSGNSLETYGITDQPVEYAYPDLKRLVHICDNDKMNSIGDGNYALSKAWYRKNAYGAVEKLRRNCSNFFINHTATKSKQNMWTTFSDYREIVESKGYTRGFLSCNSRATNKYRDRVAVAYLVNRFIDPNIKNFLYGKGVNMDEDQYALSEMLQFIWRSAIRDDKEIWVYIPSRRMRELFLKWIEERSVASGVQ